MSDFDDPIVCMAYGSAFFLILSGLFIMVTA